MSSAVLVGRDAELARLRAALERALAGSPATVVVAGEAGVGKTRVALELAREAEARGAVVLVGGCLDVAGETLPYAPVAEALRSIPTTIGPGELASVLDGARAELARLVPELGEPVTGAPEPTPGRFLELLLGVLHRLAAGRAVVLVVEDLHWADRSTRDLLVFLVRNLRGGVMLLLTYRSDELHRRHPLRPFLAELERSSRAERIDLGRLTRREVAELLERISGREPDPGLTAAVWRRSEGNPFFAEELAAAHADGAELPEALRDLLLARVEALPEPAQRLLRVAAVAGRRFDHHLLTAVAGELDEQLVEVLREAVARHVLVVEEPRGYAFRHALVQEAIYDDLLPMERAPLHAGYGNALARRINQRGGHPTAVELGQLAHHGAELIRHARELAQGAGAGRLPLVQAELLTADAEWSRVAGRSDPARWAQAAAAWEALTFPWPAAYALWHQAEALLGGDGPRHAAAEPLTAAWRTAVRLGAGPLRGRIEMLASRARIDLAATEGTEPDGGPVGPTTQLGLTDRELEVLTLVAAGRSNREIAKHLFISPKTASVHVSNILRKLGAANRVQAGAIAQRLGLGLG